MTKMSNKTYLFFLILSLLLLPILLFLFYTWLPNSSYYYINKYKENKALFVEAVKLESKSFYGEKYQIIEKDLFYKCRVDSIIQYDFSNKNPKKKYISFTMSNASGYPSDEHEYRMIIFQSDNELPPAFEKYYNVRITKKWFFVTNSYKSIRFFILLMFILLFIIITWLVGIIKICKKRYEK